ncbi:MAG TPA: carboxypeptidase-like regulatory domain-containing protein [Salinivirga sp.]|uniref:carboxypeptidase-like regulatory domain-containing protein n=1 Tax=Salinivirga sp. TaxID=1970192 RepID=UPI002B481FB2|nr:carboxypeptidase-like regulatory domain-containing protein [Salinivirga sp.]HKK58211.1 carboxypeptidase-like regulatory domain-containing protein [Salinivirga sp.]
MKLKNSHKKLRASVMILLLIAASAFQTFAQPATQTFEGKIIDNQTEDPKFYASVAIENTSIGTVTNSEGTFILKVPETLMDANLVISFIGYKNAVVPVKSLKKDKINTIAIESNSIQISEITATPKDPETIVRAMFRNIKEKYYSDPAMLEAFYRESVKERWKYQILAEAVVDIYKAPLGAIFGTDQVSIQKGRKKVNHSEIDTLLVKLRGGPRVLMYLDLIKNPSLILNEEYMKFYEYELEDIVMVNNRAHYIISFKQLPHVNFPLYNGKFYVDVKKLALKEAVFSMNMINDIETQRRFIRKKPIGMIFEPLSANYHIRYENIDGKWLFDYARATVEFKCDYRRRLFKNKYTITSEMVITDRKFTDIQPFPRHHRFYSSDILSEEIDSFTDGDFWGSKNIIDPSSDISKAVKQLIK